MNAPDPGDEACCLFVLLSDLVGCEENLLGIPQDDPCWEFQEDCPHNKLEQRATQTNSMLRPRVYYHPNFCEGVHTTGQVCTPETCTVQ